MQQTRCSGKKSIYEVINMLVMAFTVCVLIFCYFATKDTKEETITEEIVPYSIAHMADGSREFYFDLQDYDYHYSGVMFYSAHQAVRAYNSGREIYNYTKTGGFWTSTTGSDYHFIEINDKMAQMAVIVTPMYDIVADQEFTFYIGSSYAMYDQIMVDSMPRFITSLLIVILSCLIFIYYTLMHKKQQLGKELIYLGYFSFFAGVWSLNETNASILLMNNKIVDSIIPYICLMLMVPSFILFFDNYLKLGGKTIKRVFMLLSSAEFVVLNILHFTKVAEFRETLWVMQLMLVASIAYLAISTLIQIIRRNITRRVEICAVGLSLFLIAIIADFLQFYTNLGDADRLGRYALLIFVCLLAWDMIKDANDIIEKGRRAKQLEIFALTDSMTGLFNRNAFESHATAGGKLEGVVAVVADANGLKSCNDTYGHEAGDEYITAVAEIFSSVYGKYGNCYRTGGDEFCCIIPAGRQVNLDRLKRLFTAKVYTANLEGKYKFAMGVAIGSAVYDAKIDKDFRALVNRADEHMYENKREFKAGTL